MPSQVRMAYPGNDVTKQGVAITQDCYTVGIFTAIHMMYDDVDPISISLTDLYLSV